MTQKRAPGFELARAVQDPGFFPRASDAPALVELFLAEGETSAPAAQALVRLGAASSPAVGARLDSAAPADTSLAALTPEAKVALLRLLGRLPDDAASRAALLGRLADADAKVRRAAASSIGRARPAGAEAALTAALAAEANESARRAIVEALGKVGSRAALSAIGALEAVASPADAELSRTRAKAEVLITRTEARATPSVVDPKVRVEKPLRVAIRCRSGLEPVLLRELPRELGARARADAPFGPRIEATLRGAPEDLYAARTMLGFGFPLSPVALDEEEEGALESAVVASLTSAPALALLRRFTQGPLRYRLSWTRGGKRRGLTFKVAEEVNKRVPDLLNDPTDSPWEAVVHEREGSAGVELCPRFADPRFTYRLGDVPAASHPTIAAALARIGGAREDDVVWDPFAGSGTELCERARLGPYKSLVGSDLDAAALAVARKNLEAAGVAGAVLIEGDARTFVPPGGRPTLILSNPPLGRRVQRSAELAVTLERFVEHAARTLAPGGRLVWISPFPSRTREAAHRQGLYSVEELEVDMGGFAAELQHFKRGK